MNTSNKTFNISFPQALIEQIDAKTKEQFATRSDFLRTAALQYLRNEEEWQELFNYGETIGATAEPQSEEEVADSITRRRRQASNWHTN